MAVEPRQRFKIPSVGTDPQAVRQRVEAMEKLLERMFGYRVFSDSAGKMNLSLRDVAGGLLLVPQFTLAADTNKGTRPSFSSAAGPEEGRRLFEYIAQHAGAAHRHVSTGRFGADMKVSLVNDGPVTFWLRVSPTRMSQESR